MIAAIVCVLGAGLVFACVGPALARRLHPAAATRVLVPVALIIAAASTFALGVTAFTLVGQWSGIAAFGPWKPATLRADSPIPAAYALAGGLLLTIAAISTAALISRRSTALVRVHRACGTLGAPGAVVVIETATPYAFTTPEATGRIIVTRGMLEALSEPETAAMLAHEQSHIRHRHAWWLLAADLAAAINPTLRATGRALHQSVERWADEDAAAEVGDRRLVARAVARAAVAAHQHGEPVVTAAAGGNAPQRVRALLQPRPRTRLSTLSGGLACLALVAITATASIHVERTGETLFEKAMAADHHTAAARSDSIESHGITMSRCRRSVRC
jgi:hypothetical protein